MSTDDPAKPEAGQRYFSTTELPPVKIDDKTGALWWLDSRIYLGAESGERAREVHIVALLRALTPEALERVLEALERVLEPFVDDRVQTPESGGRPTPAIVERARRLATARTHPAATALWVSYGECKDLVRAWDEKQATARAALETLRLAREEKSQTSHYAHHDPKGTAGANCPACHASARLGEHLNELESHLAKLAGEGRCPECEARPLLVNAGWEKVPCTHRAAGGENAKCKSCGTLDGPGRYEQVVDGLCLGCLIEQSPPVPGGR